jgi:hypothetical protein
MCLALLPCARMCSEYKLEGKYIFVIYFLNVFGILGFFSLDANSIEFVKFSFYMLFTDFKFVLLLIFPVLIVYF